MKAAPLTFLAILSSLALAAALPQAAQEREPATPAAADSPAKEKDAAEPDEDAALQKLVSSLSYKTGDIPLSSGMAVLHLAEGWRYLGPKDAKSVLVDLWGNPPEAAGGTLGLVLPSGQEVTMDESWAIVVSWEEEGYVPDSDADEINYDDLLNQLKESSRAASAQRQKDGYGKFLLTGWALPPRYDKQAKVLHWAKAFDNGSPVKSLNYDVRVLGRRGVLSMNAVASMNQVKDIESASAGIVKLVEFTAGNRYADYVDGKDKKSDYTLAGLVIGGAVAAKVLAKGGLLLLFAKFGKLLIIPFVFVIAWLKRKFSRKES